MHFFFSLTDNVPSLRTATKLASALKLSGFVNVSQVSRLSSFLKLVDLKF